MSFAAAEPPAAGPRLWRAGTLTYTAAALVVLFGWLLWGDFAYFLKDRSVKPTLTLLLRQFHAPDLVVGVLLGFVPQVLTLLIIPAVSYRSDRHRGRWGRRIPFLLLPTPLVFFAMLGLAASPELGRRLALLLPGHLSVDNGVILVIGLCWALFETGSTVCNAVFYGLFNDVVPREVLGRFIAVFRMVTFVDGIVFNYFILGHAEAHPGWIFGGIGLFYAVSFTAMCLRVKEGEYPPPPPPEPGQGPFGAVREYFRESFTLRYYWWYYAFSALFFAATEPITLFGLYLAKSLGVTMTDYGKFLSAQMAVSLVLAYPTGWLVDRLHATRVTLWALVLFTGVAFWAFFAASDPAWFGLVVVLVGACNGICTTASTALGPALLPKERFTQFSSAAATVRMFALMPVGPLCGWLFDRGGHQYRYIYLVASSVTALAALALFMVCRHFRQRGGPAGYTAP